MVENKPLDIQWSVVIYGNQEEVLPLLEDWSLRDRYKQGLLRDQENHDQDISNLIVYDVYELGKIIATIEGVRQDGKDLRYEVSCSIKHPDETTVETLVLAEGGSWWDGLGCSKKGRSRVLGKDQHI